jgi:prepilin-type N-terminal cleavage/methylation domain-containing protein
MTVTLSFETFLKTKIRPAAGFTLLEVMVSVAVISIVLVSIIRLQGQTILMNESSRFYSTAPFLAQFKMAQILADPLNAGSETGDFDKDHPGYAWNIDIESISIDVNEGAKIELKRADVVIEFNEGQMKYTLRQYINTNTGE